MLSAHRVADVRAAEQATGDLLTSGVLMQRAAGGLAAACLRRLRSGGVYGALVVVLAGSGDNGGDALFAGARLARRGAVVRVLPTGTRLHEA
ncbi:MAG: ADP-dependent NAD(P)H-hydrate dehydratase / NAD(P)H-hydrate epimerase, partial [Frankiaceae bacterium]|nr:ADP-dependent NAD(P)H-hydrate dehydratase / NAD(P)H-hydrate epimerase [Frankiaceae bacterium]